MSTLECTRSTGALSIFGEMILQFWAPCIWIDNLKVLKTQSIGRSLLNGSRSVHFGGKSDLDPYQFTLNSNGDLDQISDLDPVSYTHLTLPTILLV